MGDVTVDFDPAVKWCWTVRQMTVSAMLCMCLYGYDVIINILMRQSVAFFNIFNPNYTRLNAFR
jgi:hypothetical protein